MAVKEPPSSPKVKRPSSLLAVRSNVPLNVSGGVSVELPFSSGRQVTSCPSTSPVISAVPPEHLPVNFSASCLNAQPNPPPEILLSSKLASTSQFPLTSAAAT